MSLHCATAGRQVAMRHSSLELTMNIYTDPVLLNVGAAIEALTGFFDRKETWTYCQSSMNPSFRMAGENLKSNWWSFTIKIFKFNIILARGQCLSLGQIEVNSGAILFPIY